MTHPNIGKRLLPLLDIIMLLLIFFIILPHGIPSDELQQISALQHQNETLKRQLSYSQWHQGPVVSPLGKEYRVWMLSVISNKLYNQAGELLENWDQTLEKRVSEGGITFVLIKIADVGGRGITRSGTIRRLEEVLQRLSVAYCVTSEIR